MTDAIQEEKETQTTQHYLTRCCWKNKIQNANKKYIYKKKRNLKNKTESSIYM